MSKSGETVISLQHKTQKLKINFRALPTPLVEWEGTAEQLHRIIFDLIAKAEGREP